MKFNKKLIEIAKQLLNENIDYCKFDTETIYVIKSIRNQNKPFQDIYDNLYSLYAKIHNTGCVGLQKYNIRQCKDYYDTDISNYKLLTILTAYNLIRSYENVYYSNIFNPSNCKHYKCHKYCKCSGSINLLRKTMIKYTED